MSFLSYGSTIAGALKNVFGLIPSDADIQVPRPILLRLVDQGYGDFYDDLRIRMRTSHPHNGPQFFSENMIRTRTQLHTLLYIRLLHGNTDEIRTLHHSIILEFQHLALRSIKVFANIGDYLCVEILTSCAMISGLRRFVSIKKETLIPTETCLSTDDYCAQVLELVYFRLLRHTLSFFDLLLDLKSINYRFTMSLENARRYAIRSLNYEEGELGPKKSVDLDGSTRDNGAQDAPTILTPLHVDYEAGDKESLERSGVRRLQAERLRAWRANVVDYPTEVLEGQKGLKKTKDELMYHLNPDKHGKPAVYPRIHKRARKLVETAVALLLLYWDHTHADEVESLERMTSEIIHNAKDSFDGIVGGVCYPISVAEWYVRES
jgi:hypothetical protein